MDETFVRIAGKWMSLFRAVDSHGQTVDFYLSETRDREAAKRFLEKRWLFRQPDPARLREGWPAELSSRTPGIANRGSPAGLLPSANTPVL
jgi:hypothetical protein